MSVYSVKGKGWRYDFTHKGTRYTETWFETKRAAIEAEVEKRKELKNPTPIPGSGRRCPEALGTLSRAIQEVGSGFNKMHREAP